MRIILSRKGFDSQYGGMPSPILPDGTMLSLPIPCYEEDIRNDEYKIRYSDLRWQNKTYDDIIKELNPHRHSKLPQYCHLDPDLRKEIAVRPKEWAPLFGQCGAAQSHLINHKIDEGDVFLFFGMFRETEIRNGILRYIQSSPQIHAIFGYLEIGSITYEQKIKEYHWHPHAQQSFESQSKNCLYAPSENLSDILDCAGYGVFSFCKNLVLTKKGYSMSRWELPSCFSDVTISRHSKENHKDGYFQTVGIGQEFVVSESKDIAQWAMNIIQSGLQKQ